MSKTPLFYLKGHLVSLLTLCNELECQAWQNNDSGIRAANDTFCSVSAMVVSAARRFPRRGASLQSWVAIFFSPSEASFSGEGYRWRRSRTVG